MAFLIIMSGEMKGRRFEIDRGEITIGRGSDNIISLPDAAASSHHCSVLHDGQNFTVRDLNSTNGTHLNGKVIKESRLKPKDIIKVGEAEIMFDGKDVEVDESGSTTLNESAAGPIRTARIPIKEVESFQCYPSAFGTRRDTRFIWLVTIAAIVMLVLAALVWFLLNLFKS